MIQRDQSKVESKKYGISDFISKERENISWYFVKQSWKDYYYYLVLCLHKWLFRIPQQALCL